MWRIPAWLLLVMLVPWTPAARAQPTRPQRWQQLDARLMELYGAGDLAGAIDAARQALSEAASPPQTGRSLDRLGFLLYTSGDLGQGERYLRQSLELRAATSGEDSLDYAETANDLAMLLRDLRRMDEAKALATTSVETRERILGDRSPELAESLNTLGTVLGLSGDYATAVVRFERALSIHESHPPAERTNEEYGTLCVNLAGTYQRLGRYEAAEAAFEKGVQALKIKPGVSHPAYAASVLAYAALKVDLGRYAEADRLYDEGGRLLGAELGEQHPLYATFLNNRGLFYQTIGNFAAAEAGYRQSLALKRQLYGPDSPLAVSTLRNLATLTLLRNPGEGEQLLSETAAAYARMSSAPPFDFCSVLVGLARAERIRGANDEARATAATAMAIGRAGLGDEHPLVAAATRERGLAAAALGDAATAEQDLQDAVAIAVRAHGAEHPDVATFLDALGDFYVGRGNFSAAHVLYARSLEIQDRYWSDILEIGSEGFKATAMAAISDPIPRLIAFMNAAGTASARSLAFEAVTRRSGRVIEQVRSWRAGLSSDPSPAVQRNLAEWRSVIGCMTSLSVALGYRDLRPALAGSCTLTGTALEGRYERLLADLRARWTPETGSSAVQAIAALRQRAESIESILAHQTTAPARSALRPGAEDLRRRLGVGETLIAFVAYTSGGAPASAPRYGAFVLNKVGDIRWHDFGPAGPIDRAVDDLSSAARDWAQSAARGERRSSDALQQTAQRALDGLSSRLWSPLEPLVAARTRYLRIAPDAALNLVPFEALADGGQTLIDRYSIAYLAAGRDLIIEPATQTSSPPVVVVSPGAAGRTSTSAPLSSQSLPVLDAADGEARDIQHVIPRVTILSGDAATESRVKALHAPPLLHIVGHGVVRGADCEPSPCAIESGDPTVAVMTRAAIVLEEAYGRSRSMEDGLLTALELENMDLHGTQMLVLSECQMAGGVPSVGEGVYGMRRAAAVAGAQTFVAPLWNVEDHVQRELMRGFYERLAAGDTRSDALRTAKLALRRSAGAGSFLEWAPVILSGVASRLPPAVFAPSATVRPGR